MLILSVRLVRWVGHVVGILTETARLNLLVANLNKPVAWMVGNMLCRLLEQAKMHAKFQSLPIVPLYTKEQINGDTREKSKRQSKKDTGGI